MSEPVSVVLSGIGGMGAVYVEALLEKSASGEVVLSGAVDPFPERSPQLGRLHELDIPLFHSLGAFYESRRAELAVISSPIQFHCDQTCLALEKGSFVLCEKPLAGTVREARRMVEAERDSGRWAAIGYQWSFSQAIQALKGDVRKGLFGKALRMKCLFLWPRDEAYYRRNDWAGRKRDRSGAWVLDSPAQNAMAHDLHNMLYILGNKPEESDHPARVEAELYRAYDVENFDTAAVRCLTEKSVEILFYFSHVSRTDRGPVLSYEFEKGVVECTGRNSPITARFRDGSVKDYGLPDAEPMKKLSDSLAGVRTGRRPVCGPAAAASQTECVCAMDESMPESVRFPAGLLSREEGAGGGRTWVEGLDEAFGRCFAAGLLPSEAGIPWSRKGRPVSIEGGLGLAP